MKIATILPRNMHFGPEAATSIDLCVRDTIQFSQFGRRTTVICQEGSEHYPGVDLFSYPQGSTRRKVRYIAGPLRALEPDLIVVHQHLPSATAIARTMPDTPILLHRHNFMKPTTGPRRLFRYRQMRALAGIVFVSNACREAFLRDYPKASPPIYAAHNGLVQKDWPFEGIKSREIIAVGRVEPAKGSLEIAEALAAVLPDHPDWTARFVGALSDDRDFVQEFEAIVNGNPQITLSGFVPFHDVVAATRQSSITVVNSKCEAFGRVAIEAFAGGAALISSDVGGLREVIGDAALVVRQGSATEIEMHLRRLLENEEFRLDLARRGRERFEQNFTMEVVARDMDAICKSVVSGFIQHAREKTMPRTDLTDRPAS